MTSVAARILASSLSMLLAACTGPGDEEPPPTPVDQVDLQRYAGRWYEIMRIPNRFQDQCARNATATYSLRDDGRLDVVNRCITASGETDEAQGIARVVEPEAKARLEVSFVRLLGFWLFWGDYWILDLGEGYRYAVVGHPERRYGWVLAREPRLAEGTLATVRQGLRGQGYDPGRFEASRQAWPQAGGPGP